MFIYFLKHHSKKTSVRVFEYEAALVSHQMQLGMWEFIDLFLIKFFVCIHIPFVFVWLRLLNFVAVFCYIANEVTYLCIRLFVG